MRENRPLKDAGNAEKRLDVNDAAMITGSAALTGALGGAFGPLGVAAGALAGGLIAKEGLDDRNAAAKAEGEASRG